MSNESGYAKLVANFENLYTHCISFGTAYSPSYPAIQLSGLGTKLGNARSALGAVQLAKTNYKDATNSREILYAGLTKLATRMINALIACNAVQQRIDDAKAIHRKLTGRRAGTAVVTGDTSREAPPVTPGTTPAPVGGATEGPGRHSVSQRGYDAMAENFAQLVVIITAEPLYNPAEVDLKTATLNDLVAQLHNANTAVINTSIQYENARIGRDNEIYNNSTGIVNLARQAKTYIKSLFGASSPQFKQVSGLNFV